MESGIGIFFESFLASFSWSYDGSLIMWIQTIVSLLCIFYTIKKDDDKSKQYLKLVFITAIWGTLYGFSLTFAATGDPHMPDDKRALILLSGLFASIQSILYGVFIWLIISVINLFIPKKTA